MPLSFTRAAFRPDDRAPLVGIVYITLSLCPAIGAVVLPWAAWRAGAVHWWVPATAAVVAEYGLPFHSTAIELVVVAALTAASGVLGLRGG